MVAIRDQRLWPPHFPEWPVADQVAYLNVRYSRADLVALIGQLADIDSIQARDPDPKNARLDKAELAELAIKLGIYPGEESDDYLEYIGE